MKLFMAGPVVSCRCVVEAAVGAAAAAASANAVSDAAVADAVAAVAVAAACCCRCCYTPNQHNYPQQQQKATLHLAC